MLLTGVIRGQFIIFLSYISYYLYILLTRAKSYLSFKFKLPELKDLSKVQIS